MGPKKHRSTHIPGSSLPTKRKAGASSSRGDGTARHRKRYEALKKRIVSPTRYPTFDSHFDTTLRNLGIEENLRMAFDRVGWMKFLEPARYTYVDLTLEFLSSLEFNEDKTIEDIPDHRLSFRIFNTAFDMSLTDFANLLGFENSGYIHDSKHPAFMPEDCDEDVFWKQITGENEYVPRTAKSSRIHNPVFRYFHKTMALTVFGRHETGTITRAELFILWSMAHSRPVNTCFYMIRHLAHLADIGTSPITVGGMVTFIAEKLGFENNFDQLEALQPLRIDYPYCCSFNLIEPIVRGSQSQSYLLISKQRSITLPNPERTEITNQGNWLYPNAAGETVFGLNEQEQEQEEEEMAEPDVPLAPQNQDFNMQEWCTRIEGQLNTQGAEIQAMRYDQRRTEDMLQALMNHFNINYDQPPGNQ